VNDDFEQALNSLSSIIVAQRHSLAIQKNSQADLIAELLAQR
jgi:guanylate kinase